jgi:D-galactarolactone isomerase
MRSPRGKRAQAILSQERTTPMAQPKRDQRRAVVPAGTCDCHMHIYTPGYALRPGAKAPSQPATLADYRKVRERLGLTRAVIVQPSAYGFDNSCTLAAMAELGDDARGVAIVDPAAPDSELTRLDGLGMRGLRYHMMQGGPLGWDTVETMAPRVAPLGWHLQFQFEGSEFTAHAPRLAALPCDFVIDHIGRFTAPVALEDENVRALFRLVDSGRCWVKLSAPYHGSRSGPPHYADIGAIARALVALAPERMLWASNWPHPSLKRDFPDEGALLDLICEWAPDEATREKILVTNPARLYRFGAASRP